MDKNNSSFKISKNFIVILCGLPASGKSTFAHTLKNNLIQNTSIGIKIVDIDEIRIKMFGEVFNPKNENVVRKEALIKTEKEIINSNIVIIDDVNYFVSMRHEYMELALKFSINYFIVYISTPLGIALKWNKNREKIIQDDIIKKIQKKFDKPGEKYSWDQPDLIVNLNKTNIEEAIDLLKKKINLKLNFTNKKNIVQPKMDKFYQKYDNITRKFVNLYSKMILDSNNSENPLEKWIIKQMEKDFNSSAKIKDKLNLFNLTLNKVKIKYENNISIINNQRRKFLKYNILNPIENSSNFLFIIQFLNYLIRE